MLAPTRRGAPPKRSSGAIRRPIFIAPPLIASGPRVGATPPSTPTSTTRSGKPAAHARAYGPPPDRPTTAILSTPSVSAMACRSSANAAMFLYRCGVDEPMPGRSMPISRMLCCSA
jgi:hypothetical protein